MGKTLPIHLSEADSLPKVSTQVRLMTKVKTEACCYIANRHPREGLKNISEFTFSLLDSFFFADVKTQFNHYIIIYLH